MRLRDYVGISERRQKQATYVMELLMVGVLFVGIERGSPEVVTNVLVCLVVIQLPPILARDYDIHMDAGLTLWITAAVFFHAIGMTGIPGGGGGFYTTLSWWDHFTHALSASVVAAVGYATIRALEEYTDGVSLPDRFMFVFILLFVVAFGVVWEVIEFTTGFLGTTLIGRPFLSQHGIEDTMLDLVFDTIGAIVVATWGTAHLTDFSNTIGERLAARKQ